MASEKTWMYMVGVFVVGAIGFTALQFFAS